MLKRALGVKGAVLVLYGITALFAALGVALSEGRGRVTYALALVFAAFIGVTSFKIARREQIEKQARDSDAVRLPEPSMPSKQPPPSKNGATHDKQETTPAAEKPTSKGE
jgi:hypothetical protein